MSGTLRETVDTAKRRPAWAGRASTIGGDFHGNGDLLAAVDELDGV